MRNPSSGSKERARITPMSPNPPDPPSNGQLADSAGPSGQPRETDTAGDIGRGVRISRRALTIAAVVVIAVGAAAFLLTRDRGAGPTQTVQHFYDAALRLDCDDMADLVSAETLERSGIGRLEPGQACSRDGADRDLRVIQRTEVGEARVVEQEGDDATVEVEVTEDGVDHVEQVFLVREDGEWKVQFVLDESRSPLDDEQ